jgi:hypothetical protein
MLTAVLLSQLLLTTARCRHDLGAWRTQDLAQVPLQTLAQESAEMNACAFVDEEELRTVFRERAAGGSKQITYTEQGMLLQLERMRRMVEFLKRHQMTDKFLREEERGPHAN